MAEATIEAIITNNKKLLDIQIGEKIVKNLIRECKSQKKNERFMNLLSALCICQNDAVVKN